MRLPELADIEKQRKKLGITQTELAKKAKVSQSLIARLEAGTVDPRYSKVAQVFRALSEIERKEIHAGELMTEKVVGAQTDETIEDVVKLMKKFQVSQIPLFERKKIVGSISERVILEEIARGADMQDFSHRKAGEFMDHPFPIVNKKTPMTTLSRLLDHNTAVLVSEKGDIRGIITNSDILKVVRR